MEGRIQIDRFRVRNFRSIQECDVELEPLTFFIGANGSGKTSFVDAILFVSSALRSSLDKAIADRGGIHSILHQPTNFPASSGFEFRVSSQFGFACEFKLELRITEDWVVSVIREECRITASNGEVHYYLVEDGRVTGSAAVFPAVSVDRVFLANASGLPEFRLLFDFLAGIGSTEPTMPGVHLAVRFKDLIRSQPERLEIIQQYLRAIAPPFERVDVLEAGGDSWLRFVEKSKSGESMPFYLSQASAGLVSSAEILLELFQLPGEGKPASPVIIEEPEALLHPGAIHVIRDGFLEASRTRQVLVTTHSPDFLDDPSVAAKAIRTVRRDDGGTHVDHLDAGTNSIIRDHLYTAGELLRQGGLILRQ